MANWSGAQQDISYFMFTIYEENKNEKKYDISRGRRE